MWPWVVRYVKEVILEDEFSNRGFSKGWKESFMSGEQEPWVFRGGLTADLQRLIPVDSGSDLFVYKAPDIPTSKIYTVRPYIIEDEMAVYDVCRKTCIEDAHLSQMMTEHPDLAPDRFVGAFLTFSPELCFVVEDESGIVGYACAALDAKQFQTKLQVAWLPEMCSKYPTEMSTSSSLPAQEMIRWFHSFKSDGDAVSDSIKAQHPSTMTCSLLSSVFDQSVAKRLVICALAALRANGSFGVHVPVNSLDRPLIEFYSKLGFIELTPSSNAPVDRTILLGRAF